MVDGILLCGPVLHGLEGSISPHQADLRKAAKSQLSEPLTNTGRNTTFPGLGQDDKLRERKQNLNYNRRPHSEALIIRISFLKLEAQSKQ